MTSRQQSPEDLFASQEAFPSGNPPREERCRVLLPLPVEEPYDYLAPLDPNGLAMGLVPGALVEVPVGPRKLTGVVWFEKTRTGKGEAYALSRLRSVLSVRDVPPLTEELMKTIEWVADYTLAPLGAVLKMALSVPAAFAPEKGLQQLRLSDAFDSSVKLTDARRKVVSVLQKGGGWSPGDLAREAGVSPSVVKGLEKTAVLTRYEEQSEPAFPMPDLSMTGPTLSPDQDSAARSIVAALDEEGFRPILLDGVTGSGKTEVYFEAMFRAFEKQKQVLVLLPEIALSAQWLGRFKSRFGVEPAQWHSDLTPSQRRKTWRAVASGRAPVVIGARSALFLPFPDLGLIVVDEEHESSFKQEDGVHYHGRDMAVVRAKEAGIAIVMASATPALETITNAQNGRYEHLVLPGRHGGAGLPDVELVDLRVDKPPREGRAAAFLSPTLREAVRQTLDAGEQAMLFLNRRGYAPLTLCRTCGHRFQCPHCATWLVEHRQWGRLQCHHCGYQVARPETCPSCEAEDTLVPCGPGVERIAEEAALLFPESRLALMTSDSLTSPAMTRAMVERVQSGDVNLLIGTQVVAKGYHFPDLTLVGVVDADLGLFGGDPRAAERTFQLMHQVAGRAGRAEKKGRVLLQTHDPDQAVMQALASGDRDRFLAEEADNRSRGGLPPYGRMVALIVSGADPQALDDFCLKLRRKAPEGQDYRVLGPVPAPIAMLRGKHRRRFLLQARRSVPVQGLVRQWLDLEKIPSSIRVTVDVDPYSFF